MAESETAARAVDWPGALLATSGLGIATWALTLASSQRRIDAGALVGVAIGVALLAGFVAVERARGDRAMMPLALFASRAFAGLSVLTLLLYGALAGLLLLLPWLLITGGYPPARVGFAMLPLAVGIGAGSRIMGGIAGRIGPRWPLTIGPLVTAVGLALMIRVEPAAPYWSSVFPALVVVALGMAVAVAPLTTAVLASVDTGHTGTASGFNSALARTGGLIATALAGLVMSRHGDAATGAFHAAALVGAALAALAGAVAFLTLSSR